ncbi:NAD(P)-binding protein [Podospora aff. communis PSN243]|uniref:NAD(P)-binding protein n=1 Tax=Podospora aff. communis PSN243 TaxID=3040156 RepID=A0AAV9G8S2_9PEZI|nr:NAD(P)-binding protein [Podospora aff. communis PSN243]
MTTPDFTTKLTSSRILILGGTSGVGFGVAQAALQFGASVIISSSNPTKITRSLDRLRAGHPTFAPGQTISGQACDLANSSTLEANLASLLDFATENGKLKLNHVVFTAGDAIAPVPLAQITPEDITRQSQIRFHGAVMLAKLLPKYIHVEAESSITFTGGTNTDKPMAGWSVIAAVGAAVEGLTRGLAVDLKPVRVNTVSLGAVLTELFDGFLGDDKEKREKVLAGMRQGTLVGEVGRVEDVAEAYLYLMRDRFATGTVLKTNGGRMLV